MSGGFYTVTPKAEPARSSRGLMRVTQLLLLVQPAAAPWPSTDDFAQIRLEWFLGYPEIEQQQPMYS